MHDFTVLIPTHNRQKYVRRSIVYYKDLDAKVIYCDSSDEPYSGKLADNMVYMHMPGKRFAEKLVDTLEQTGADIVVLCADDDFILIESLYQGFEYITQPNAAGTILGKNIAFYEEFDGAFYGELNADTFEYASDSASNVREFFSNYHQVLWGMYRKKVLYDTCVVVRDAGFRNDNFIELTLGAIACHNGGIRKIDEIWAVRELSMKEHWGDRHASLRNYYKVKSIRKDFKKLKPLLDSKTKTGYSELVLRSYLGLGFKQKAKISIKAFFEQLIPKKIINLKNSKDNPNRRKSKYPLLPEISPAGNISLYKIKSVLNSDE